jgi:hypothetical protein
VNVNWRKKLTAFCPKILQKMWSEELQALARIIYVGSMYFTSTVNLMEAK